MRRQQIDLPENRLGVYEQKYPITVAFTVTFYKVPETHGHVQLVTLYIILNLTLPYLTLITYYFQMGKSSKRRLKWKNLEIVKPSEGAEADSLASQASIITLHLTLLEPKPHDSTLKAETLKNINIFLNYEKINL